MKNCKIKNKERKIKPLLITDEPLCQDGFLACGDSSCLERGLFCNGEKNCADGSDENSCGEYFKNQFNASTFAYNNLFAEFLSQFWHSIHFACSTFKKTELVDIWQFAQMCVCRKCHCDLSIHKLKSKYQSTMEKKEFAQFP